MTISVQLNLMVFQLTNTSYKVRLTENPTVVDVSIRERTSNGHYTEVGVLDSDNWESGISITGRVQGETYYIIGVGSEGTVMRETSVVLPAATPEELASHVDDEPVALYTGSIRTVARLDPTYRSDNWKKIYGN